MPPPVTDPVESARQAGLRYVTDASPGIRRLARGGSFRYVAADGKPLRDAATLRRIRALVIPPAWTDVWICPSASGHIQATGRDARGRKQYRYHPRYRAVRDETKFHRMIGFAAALPRIRQRTEEDLARPGLPREKVLATVVRLLELTLIRVGNEEYARANHSFGLTTLRARHVDVAGSKVRFEFRGKSGKAHAVELGDRRLARIVQRCQDLPGEELFQFVDADGGRHVVDSSDVNEYLREIAGGEYTAKDFRTWAGTVMAACALRELALAEDVAPTQAAAKRHVVQAIETVASRLGNTKAVCRKSYVHPAVIEAFLDGELVDGIGRGVEKAVEREVAREAGALREEEAALARFLERRLAAEAEKRRKSDEALGLA